MMNRERDNIDAQVAAFVAGEIGLESVDFLYQKRALVERIAALEAKVEQLACAVDGLMMEIDGDASHDAVPF